MNLDERLERLADTHEALAQSVELINARTAEQGSHIAEQGAQIARQSAQIADLRELMAAQNAQTVRTFEIALDSIKRLERIALAHERRIDDHDGRLEDLENKG